MNPELRRNVWLELTTRRITLMVVMLGLAFFAATVTGSDYRPAALAEFLYYVIVVVWGARNAAVSVVGEIRDRTWDLQRLSSLGAAEMTWGKLFGSTLYNWFGGAICLAVILVAGFPAHGLLTTALDVVYFVSIGIIAQATSMLASLIAVRRRQSHTRFEIFLYQVLGLLAALGVFYVWEAADPAGSIITPKPATDFIVWWGQSFDSRGFLLSSLALFTLWTFVGCYREMRLELKMRNGPFVWLAFLFFTGIYAAGFDAWLSQNEGVVLDAVGLRLALALTVFAVLTYVMVLLEPKDRVLYRWIGGNIAKGRLGPALGEFQGWMMSFIACAIMSIALIVWLGRLGGDVVNQRAIIASGLGFLTRDCAIVVLLHASQVRRRGDFAAIVVLIALYFLVPQILHGLALDGTLAVFYPKTTTPAWFGPALAWAEATAAVAFAVGRIAIGEKRVTTARA